MSDDMLQDLRMLAPRLNEASDLLNSRLSDVEKALNNLRLGVAAWVPLYSWEGEGQLHHFEQLGFSKHKGKWALVVSSGVEEFPDHDSVELLRDSTRQTRLDAVDRLESLLTAIRKAAERFAEHAEEQAHKAHVFAAQLANPEAPTS